MCRDKAKKIPTNAKLTTESSVSNSWITKMKGQTFFLSHGENCALLLAISSKFLHIYCSVCERKQTKPSGNGKRLPTVSPALAHSHPHVQKNGYLVIQT